MKDWFKYIVASVAGLALVILLPEAPVTGNIIATGSMVFNNLGQYLLIPFILVACTAGIASIRRQRQGLQSIGLSIGWGLLNTVVLTIIAGMVSWVIFTADFSGISGNAVEAVTLPTFTDFISGVISPNILTLFVGNYTILPIILFAFLLGVVLKPEEDFIRPAFAVMNSFSEAFYKIARIITEVMILGLVFISGAWFAESLNSGAIQGSLRLVFMVGIITGAAVFLILPMMLLLIGKTRKPYTWLFALSAPAILAFFSGSSYTAQTTLMLHSRNNIGAAKRICSTTAPLLLVLGRSGTAAISIITINSLYSTVYGSSIPFGSLLLAILFTILLSLTVVTAPGFEILLIVTVVGTILGIDFGSNLAVVLPMLPFLAGAAALIDIVTAGFGIGAISRILQAHSPVQAKDFL